MILSIFSCVWWPFVCRESTFTIPILGIRKWRQKRLVSLFKVIDSKLWNQDLDSQAESYFHPLCYIPPYEGRMPLFQVIFSHTYPYIGLMAGFWARGEVGESSSFLPPSLPSFLSTNNYLYPPGSAAIWGETPWRTERLPGQNLSYYQGGDAHIGEISWVSV